MKDGICLHEFAKTDTMNICFSHILVVICAGNWAQHSWESCISEDPDRLPRSIDGSPMPRKFREVRKSRRPWNWQCFKKAAAFDPTSSAVAESRRSGLF